MQKKTNKSIEEKIFLIFFSFLIGILILLSQINCPIRKIFHVFCPGCGVTRMVLSLVKLDFYAAFRYNPLVFILIPIILINMFLIKNRKIQNIIWYVLIFITILFGIVRNLETFSYLTPTKI